MSVNYTIFLISNRPDKYGPIQKSLLPELLFYFDGSNVKCFSELVNRCVEIAPTETVIIASDRVLPTQEHVKKILQYLDKNYGFVGLYRFAFFGFKKELLRKIGMFDERYIGGGYEDTDFVNRLIMANIGFFITEEVPYRAGPTRWQYEKSAPHYLDKWYPHWGKGPHSDIPLFEKKIQEEIYDYDLGESVPTQFLTCKEHTYVEGPDANMAIVPFLLTEIVSAVPLEFINK